MYRVPITENARGFKAGVSLGIDILLRGNDEIVIAHAGAFQTNRTMMSFT